MYGTVVNRVVEVADDRGYVFHKGAHAGKVNMARLSRDSGVSTRTLAKLTRKGRRSAGIPNITLAKLCHALQVTPGDLLAYVPAPQGGRALDVDTLLGAN